MVFPINLSATITSAMVCSSETSRWCRIWVELNLRASRSPISSSGDITSSTPISDNIRLCASVFARAIILGTSIFFKSSAVRILDSISSPIEIMAQSTLPISSATSASSFVLSRAIACVTSFFIASIFLSS